MKKEAITGHSGTEESFTSDLYAPTLSYREFNSLTDDEIRSAMNYIFQPINIGDITRVDEQHISVDIFIMPEHPGIVDTIDLTEDDMETHDFDLTDESVEWRQFLLSKGIHPLLKDNPFAMNTDYATTVFRSLDGTAKRELYILLRKEYVQEDVKSHMQDIEKPLTEERVANVVNAYVRDCTYDCNQSYWENLETLIRTEYDAQTSDIKNQLKDKKGDYDLSDVELTDEDIQTVLMYMAEHSFDMDMAVRSTLAGIEEMLAECEAERE